MANNNLPLTRLEKACQILVNNDPNASEKINLGYCLMYGYANIRYFGAFQLCIPLSVNTTITFIDLSFNKIVVSGAIELASAFKTNTTLIFVNLSYNDIEDAGAEAIANALEVNTSINNILLSGNLISAVGAKALAKCLGYNTTLQELKLNTNNIGDVGVEVLAFALETNITLINLDLRLNEISSVGLSAIMKALQSNMTMIKLQIDFALHHHAYFNLIPQETEEKIKQLMERNTTIRMGQYWSPCYHVAFPFHKIVLTSLICNDEFSARLPIHVWKYIFSFWKREHLE